MPRPPPVTIITCAMPSLLPHWLGREDRPPEGRRATLIAGTRRLGCRRDVPGRRAMSADDARAVDGAPPFKGEGIVLQPEEGTSYWQPAPANGYGIVKV